MSFRASRLKAGKQVSEVMKHMSVTDGTVYQWETGVTMPNAAKLTRLADFYGCTVDELLRDNETRNKA